MKGISELYAICEDRNRWMECKPVDLAKIAHAIEREVDSEYIPLPKDMDGEPIHVNDKVDWRDHSGVWHTNVPVVAVSDTGVYVSNLGVFHVHHSDVRHHKVMTLRDKLYDSVRCCLEEWMTEHDGQIVDYGESSRGD